MLNSLVFENTQKSEKHILTVTKYWDKKTTEDIISESTDKYLEVFYGIGENRIESIREKDLPRELVHFIGNIQSRKIPDIVDSCCTIHSLANPKHAQKIENQEKPVSAFIQIQLDPEKPIGIEANELAGFLETCKGFTYLKVIGISGMGRIDITQQEKRSEFQKLITIRDQHLPEGLISAGTSQDYEIALEEGIDIVRVGQKILTTE